MVTTASGVAVGMYMNTMPTIKMILEWQSAAFDALSEGVVVQDLSSRILWANEAALIILGLTTDQIEGRDSYDPRWRTIRRHGQPFDGNDHPSSEVLRTEKPVRDVIMGLFRPDQTFVWISINAVPITDPSTGQMSGVAATFTDVTEREQTADFVRLHAGTHRLMSRSLQQQDLLAEVCKLAVDHLNICLCWIGRADYENRQRYRHK